MTDIYDWTRTQTLAAGDLLAIYDTSESDKRAASLTALLTFLQSNLTFTAQGFTDYVTQYAAPSASGFSVSLTDGADDDGNIHLILTPVAGYAAGTLVLPAVGSLVDKQEILVNSTQAVTTLTITANGATAVTGAPTALTANQFFRLKYDAATSTWYCIG